MAGDEGTSEGSGEARENVHEGSRPDDDSAAAELIHGAPTSESLGQRVLHPTRDQLLDVVTALAEDGYDMCLDLTGVDYLAFADRALPPGVTPERFEVVITLLDHQGHERLRLRVQVPAADPTCPSIVSVHAGAEAHERETYDMFGVVFDGHPDPTRILMPEDWDGHPLRKDDGVGAIPVQFKGAGREVRP